MLVAGQFTAFISCPPWREEEEEEEPVFSVQVNAMTAAAAAQHTMTMLKGARGTPWLHSLQGTVCVCALQGAAVMLVLLLLTQSGVSRALWAAAAT